MKGKLSFKRHSSAVLSGKSVADPDLELRGGPGFEMLKQN